jgi:hypothetical protein
MARDDVMIAGRMCEERARPAIIAFHSAKDSG